MTSDVASGGNAADLELANLFVGALAGEYACSEDAPFYSSVVLSGQPAEDETLTAVAYSAVYNTIEVDRLQWLYVAFPSSVQVQTHTQLMMALMRHGAPDCNSPEDGKSPSREQCERWHGVLFAAGLHSSPRRLPAFAVVHSVTDAGVDCVEFVAPHKFDHHALISYMQYGYGAFWH